MMKSYLKKGPSLARRIRALAGGRTPGQLVIQITDRCNARCPQCGMNITNRFDRSTLPPGDVIRIIEAASEKGIQAISFTGGEPLLYPEYLSAYMKHAAKKGIKYIRTGTNGFIFMGSDKPGFYTKIGQIAEILARTRIRNFWISIDSAHAHTHETMRGLPGVMAGIEKALPVFHDHGIYPSANLGINRNLGGPQDRHITVTADSAGHEQAAFYRYYQTAFRKFYNRVMDMGFTMANSCYPMSTDTAHEPGNGLSAVYAATSTAPEISFNHAEKALIFSALFDTIPEFRNRIRIFTPRASLLALCRQYKNQGPTPHACRGGIDYFHVDARNGHTFPCGYRGNEDFGYLWDLDMDAVDTRTACRKCDWECFRDPSELLGPLIQAMSSPAGMLKKFMADPLYARTWITDLGYYQACDFFDSRKPPNFRKLARFKCITGYSIPENGRNPQGIEDDPQKCPVPEIPDES